MSDPLNVCFRIVFRTWAAHGIVMDFFPEPDYSTIILTLVGQVLYFYLSASTVDVLLSYKPTLYPSASTVDVLLGTNPITLPRLQSTS